MSHDQLLVDIRNSFKSKAALAEYVTANFQEAMPPSPSGTVLMDFRPVGGIVIGGYEDGHWWNLDNGAQFDFRPSGWAPLPPQFSDRV